MGRGLTAYDVLRTWCRTVRPAAEFRGRTPGDVRRWRMRFAPAYRRMIGRWPERVPPRVRVTARTRCDGYVRERVLYDSSPGVTVPAFRLVPEGLAPGERRPALLAAHGHGGGKADICRVPPPGKRREHERRVRALNYDYAVQATRRGYVVIAPDWLPFGERKPPAWWHRTWRDPCDPVGLGFRYFGRHVLTQNVWDGMRAVDLLVRHPNADARRIGVIGLSYGGTMATHLLANDPRIRAGVVSGYVSTVRHDALGRRGTGNTCGSQVVPDLLLHGDIPEILGLAAPKPVLCEIGTREDCFHHPDMVRAFRRAARIWRAAGAGDRIAADIFNGTHRWSGRKAWDFLARWL